MRPRLIHKRTRAGCQVCRKRRKRCDEGRPVCGGCVKLKLKCTYDMHLRWADTRRPFFEQNKPPRLRPFESQDFASVSHDTPNEKLRQLLLRIEATQEQQRTIFSTLGAKDQEILLAFLTSGYRTLSSNFKVDDEFLSCYNAHELSEAGLWGDITYQVSMDPAYDELFDEYYYKCLKLCREELSDAALAGNYEPLYCHGFVLAGISLQRLLPWTNHLNAMMAVLKSRGELDAISPEDSECEDFLRALGSLELPSHILNRKTQHYHFWSQYCRGGTGVEEGCGLPCSLIDLLSQLGNPSTTDALLSWQAPEGELAQICSWDATRFAAIIRAFEDSKTDQGLDVATWLMCKGISLQDLVDSVLTCVQECLPRVPPELGHFKQTLLFPLVMAASQRNLLSAEAKDFICQTIQHEASERNYYHYLGVVRIIQAHWANDAETIEETARRMDIELGLW